MSNSDIYIYIYIHILRITHISAKTACAISIISLPLSISLRKVQAKKNLEILPEAEWFIVTSCECGLETKRPKSKDFRTLYYDQFLDLCVKNFKWCSMDKTTFLYLYPKDCSCQLIDETLFSFKILVKWDWRFLLF